MSSPFGSVSSAASGVEHQFGMLPQEPCATRPGLARSHRGGAGKLQSEEPWSQGRGTPNHFHCGQRKRLAGEAERVATHTALERKEGLCANESLKPSCPTSLMCEDRAESKPTAACW